MTNVMLVESGDGRVRREGVMIHISDAAFRDGKRLFRTAGVSGSLVRYFAESRLANPGETDVVSDEFVAYVHDQLPDFVFLARRDHTRWVVGGFDWRTAGHKMAAKRRQTATVRRQVNADVPFPHDMFDADLDGLMREELVSLKEDATVWMRANPFHEERPAVVSRVQDIDRQLGAMKAHHQASRDAEFHATILRLENRIALLEHKLGVAS